MSKRPRWNLGNVLDWSVADRCILAASIVLVFTTSYAFAVYYYLLHPQVIDFANSRFVQNGIFGFGIASYWLGHYTSLFTGVTIIGGATIGLILFERRPVLLGVATYLAIIVGTTIGEQLGMLRYAPALIGSPVRDGHLSGWWLVSIGGITLALVVVVLAVIDYIVRQWREHELMVFFGAPVATEDRDHAARAVRMALDMQERVTELSATWLDHERIEEPFQIRIGINSGVASVGNFGSKERLSHAGLGERRSTRSSRGTERGGRDPYHVLVRPAAFGAFQPFGRHRACADGHGEKSRQRG